MALSSLLSLINFFQWRYVKSYPNSDLHSLVLSMDSESQSMMTKTANNFWTCFQQGSPAESPRHFESLEILKLNSAQLALFMQDLQDFTFPLSIAAIDLNFV